MDEYKQLDQSVSWSTHGYQKRVDYSAYLSEHHAALLPLQSPSILFIYDTHSTRPCLFQRLRPRLQGALTSSTPLSRHGAASICPLICPEPHRHPACLWVTATHSAATNRDHASRAAPSQPSPPSAHSLVTSPPLSRARAIDPLLFANRDHILAYSLSTPSLSNRFDQAQRSASIPSRLLRFLLNVD